MNRAFVSRPKTHVELADEWNRLAEERHRQIVSGDDLSFHHVVVPVAKALLSNTDLSVVLDVGSGTGEFTRDLAQIAGSVIAVEPSTVSMGIARTVCALAQNVAYVEAPLELSVANLRARYPTAAVAMMTLMTTPSLPMFARALADVMPMDSRFVATLTHPCFWPRYWGYDREEWFVYERELFVEAPFAISRCRSNVRTTHIHRPISYYLNTFAGSGFALEEVAEPIPAVEIQRLYPEAWMFPRFLALKWKRVANVG